MESRKSLTLAAIAVTALAGGRAAGAEEAAGARAIVGKAIEHHGGERFVASETSFEIASKSGTFRVEVRRDGGLYRHAVETLTQEGWRRVEATNDRVTVTVGGKPRPVPKDEEQRWRDHVAARVWFPFLPYGLLGDGVHLQDLGLEEWPLEPAPTASGEAAEAPAGRASAAAGAGPARVLHKVKVTFAPGSSSSAEDEYLFWFDPGTGRLEQYAYSFDGGLRFRRAKNFREVGGLLFADHENYGIDQEGREVDEVTPARVANEMAHVSTIELRDIQVQSIE